MGLWAWSCSVGVCRLLPPIGGASMAAVHGVAGATGRVARRGSRSPARPLMAGAAASTVTAPLGLAGGPPSAGGPKERWGAAARSIYGNC